MAQLAIKGHATRGKEVIEILEMLGGVNRDEYNGDKTFAYYFINNNYIDWRSQDPLDSDFISFTLEEFLEKFPYKVGDKVWINDHINDIYTIKLMVWETGLKRVAYRIEAMDGIEGDSYWYAAEMLYYTEPKEETVENKGTLVEIDLTREETKAEEIEVILGDYEFVLKEGKTYFVKKKPQYPKTYDECCKVISVPIRNSIGGHKWKILQEFQKLIVCRDAYWKIGGEPDIQNNECYCLYYSITDEAILKQEGYLDANAVLTFPTKEMRDAFYENFKDLIETCKELL